MDTATRVSTFFTTVASPIGPLTLTSDGRAMTGLYVAGHTKVNPRPPSWARDDSLFDQAGAELDEYWSGTRRHFSVPLATGGTPFQQSVWGALCRIPYGETATYTELAHAVGRPAAARAVGAANGRNPISIFVPCHRVIGANTSLTGYAGGLDTKRWLLRFEGALAA